MLKLSMVVTHIFYFVHYVLLLILVSETTSIRPNLVIETRLWFLLSVDLEGYIFQDIEVLFLK